MLYVLIALIALVLGLVAAIAAWAIFRGRTEVPDVATQARVDTKPMTDLESALAQVKDRSGRPIGERIEAEHVDDLRIADDTGPLLRRALDQVRPADEAAADANSVGDAGTVGDSGDSGDVGDVAGAADEPT